MTPSAGWYPVALSGGVEAGTSNGTHLFGREIVVWRDGRGTAHVWQDRCPHRGMRLSFGFVRGDRIACLYHGWNYDAAGRCRYIPAHPSLTPPESIRVEAYATAERAGMIWVYSGAATEAPIPPDEYAVVPVRSLHVECPPEDAVRELLAANVLPFTADANATASAAPIAPALFAIAAGSDRLLVGVQPIAPDETALHIAIAGGSEYRSAGQRHFNDWAETLRRRLERPETRSGPGEYPGPAAP